MQTKSLINLACCSFLIVFIFVFPCMAETINLNEEEDVTAAYGDCTWYSSISIYDFEEYSSSMRARLCRGTEDGCAATGKNWCSILVCYNEMIEETCHEFFIDTTYGRYTVSEKEDISDIVDSYGEYDFYICERGRASGTNNPCCYPEGKCDDGCWGGHPDCGPRCEHDARIYAHCHLDWIKVNLKTIRPNITGNEHKPDAEIFQGQLKKDGFSERK